MESVDHVRFLCWLYIGALTHHAVAENVLHTKCQPLPFDDVNNISVMVMSIMTGFVEYSASSVEFMSSLFYAFILCQVMCLIDLVVPFMFSYPHEVHLVSLGCMKGWK